MRRVLIACVLSSLALAAAACSQADTATDWEAANPVRPIPPTPLGIEATFAELAEPPRPERVRLGRWLFYDKRLSADGTIACSTCHRPENGFSEPTPHSTGIKGQEGNRKSPSFLNQAWTLYPHFFWDGRASSLEEQALGPVANPIEMGNTHETMVQTLSGIAGYAPYFEEAFGTPGITKERVAKAIADYERTCMSGNSPWDRWQRNHDESAVSEAVKLGDRLFSDKARCVECHVGQNFTDSSFHNLGIGWDPVAKKFADEGRFAVTKDDADRGAFKTPGLRDVALRAPYMHDGSVATLRETVLHYRDGGTPNPTLDPRIEKIDLTDAEVDALVAFMQALTGESPKETAPTAFPR